MVADVTVLAVSAAVLKVHQVWAWVVIVSNALAGLWALAAHRDERFRMPALWRFTAAAEIAIFVQVVLGVILIQGRSTDRFGFHVLYGFSAAFAVGIVYSYRNQLGDKLYLLYGCGGLFIMGLGLRAITTLPT